MGLVLLKTYDLLLRLFLLLLLILRDGEDLLRENANTRRLTYPLDYVKNVTHSVSHVCNRLYTSNIDIRFKFSLTFPVYKFKNENDGGLIFCRSKAEKPYGFWHTFFQFPRICMMQVHENGPSFLVILVSLGVWSMLIAICINNSNNNNT